MARSKLTDDVKTFIVQALACFDTPSQVVDAVNQEFGVTVTRQNVEKYDPTKVAGKNLAPKWRAMFEQARKSFIEDSSQIAIAHRSTRLRALQRMAAKAEAKGNFPLAAQLHKQAAEEMGNAYTNRRELTGKDGKDLPAPAAPVAIFALPDNGRDG
ncbi:DUF2280 domain-containing protein [Pelagerythrobacter marinus]|uniref:DUF2280 domain-containing protein n=1 Tax=Pelagerythrobacter marinus TaxID=538382 RepID=UPI002AC95D1F|nr:DUF2280 domain-containing protein [Pelagerythrobacter marinus]WPZ05647.1 DUF2280 domain-containing protein [Pelagerythrobacter marinus]